MNTRWRGGQREIHERLFWVFNIHHLCLYVLSVWGRSTIIYFTFFIVFKLHLINHLLRSAMTFIIGILTHYYLYTL